MSTKLVTVLGITGNQGRSVADALLKDGHWKVRGITRDANKPESKELIAKGVELVEGDATNPEVVKKAFHGAYGVFAITAFWDKSQMGKEQQIGKMTADIAKECKVQHYIWSSLPNVEKITSKYHVPHFTDKALVDEHIVKIGLKHTFIMPAFFMQNFSEFFPVKKDKNGVVVFSMPTPESTTLTSVDITDIGHAVLNFFNHPHEWEGKSVPFYGTHQPITEYIKLYTETTHNKARYEEMPRGSMGEELQHMLDYFKEFGYYGPNWDKSLAVKANPNVTSWTRYVKEGHVSPKI